MKPLSHSSFLLTSSKLSEPSVISRKHLSFASESIIYRDSTRWKVIYEKPRGGEGRREGGREGGRERMIEKQTNVERSYNDAKQYGIDHGL